MAGTDLMLNLYNSGHSQELILGVCALLGTGCRRDADVISVMIRLAKFGIDMKKLYLCFTKPQNNDKSCG